jgi:hypothetical protein
MLYCHSSFLFVVFSVLGDDRLRRPIFTTLTQPTHNGWDPYTWLHLLVSGSYAKIVTELSFPFLLTGIGETSHY